MWAQCSLLWINYSPVVVHFAFATGLSYSAGFFVLFFFFLSWAGVWSSPSLATKMFLSGSNHLRTFSPYQWVARNSRMWFCFSENGFSMFSEAGWKIGMWSSPFVNEVIRGTLFLEWPAYSLGVELTNWWEIFSKCGTSNLLAVWGC